MGNLSALSEAVLTASPDKLALSGTGRKQKAPTAAQMPAAEAAATRARKGHLAYLDGLRGVAILAVLTIHASLLVTELSQPIRDLTFYGVRGVQLFFIVSGFTLMVSHAGRRLELLNFATRRFFRIAPMFYLGIAVYLLLSRVTAMPLPTRDAGAIDIVATLLFLHGWLPSAVNTVVPGGWSIAAEAMFYLVFPFVLMLTSRPRTLLAVTILSYLVAGVINIALRKLASGTLEPLAFPFWLVHFPAFIGGCCLTTLPASGPVVRRMAPWVLGLATLGLLVDSQLHERSNLLVAIALLTILVWSAGVSRPRWLESRTLTFLGKISFSIYIVHFAVLGCIRPLAPHLEVLVGAEITLLTVIALTLAVASGIASCTYRWIEQPIIAATRHIGRHISS